METGSGVTEKASRHMAGSEICIGGVKKKSFKNMVL